MSSFSERMGLKEVRSIIQQDSIDLHLSTHLWNALYSWYFGNIPAESDRLDLNAYSLLTEIWTSYFHREIDKFPRYTMELLSYINSYWQTCDWNEVYDFVEFVPQHYTGKNSEFTNKHYYAEVNKGLEKYLSAYRFVRGILTKISAEEEIEAIESAIIQTTNLPAVRSHLNRALELFSDRENPDFRNSIKESISAIESLAKIISGNQKDTLAAALDKIKRQLKIHKGLEQGFKNIYGYTSDDGGIRHALTEESTCDTEDAKFMLVSCSAFVNYLLVKADKAGIALL